MSNHYHMLIEVDAAEDYTWSSGAHYVRGTDDHITDCNPYLGATQTDKPFRDWYGLAPSTPNGDALEPRNAPQISF